MSDPTLEPKPDPTPCPEREEALALHAGGDLPEAAARELERHLADCEGCRTFLAEMEESLQAFAGWTVAPPAKDLSQLHQRVMETLRNEKSGGVSPWRRSSVRWAAAAALLLILGAALLWRLGTDREPNRPEPRDPVIAARTDEPDEPRVEPRALPPQGTTPPNETVREAPEIAEEPVGVPGAPVRTEPPQPNVTPEPVPRTVPRSVPEPETQRAGLQEDPPDLKIQLISDDPGVVIYWLVETEKPQDATSTT